MTKSREGRRTTSRSSRALQLVDDVAVAPDRPAPPTPPFGPTERLVQLERLARLRELRVLTGRTETTGGKPVRRSNSHELAAKDACCCAVRWDTFLGSQFQMDWVGRVIALS